MNAPVDLTPRNPDPALARIIKLAIIAVGGQGGGVLTGWIEAVARAQGYVVQATSVAGVAQRTGATIYYLEMAPETDRMPVFSLAPSPGDVDIVIAAEMMEAGRAVLRGFVTPDRTTLIASTHRALAVSEKMAPGDGIADANEVRAAAEIAAEKLVMFNMDALAVANGSVISSSLLGALAASGALPFPRTAFEDAIRASGKGVAASLRAFDAAFTRTGADEATPTAPAPQAPPPQPRGPQALLTRWQALAAQAAASEAPDMALAGLRKVVAFQDARYGADYLDRLDRFAGFGPDLAAAAAKHIANAMSYDDMIRVADLKTRAARFDRIRAEMGAGDRPMNLTEFMHPRAEEVIGLMPAGMGAWVNARPALVRVLDRLVNRGRRLRPHRLRGFVPLFLMGGLRGWRRRTLRHRQEIAALEEWLDRCASALPADPAFAAELLRCQRLVKGYSDTHLRGQSKFARVMAAAALVQGREDAAQWVARLREAALADEKGEALDGAIRTIRSFAGDGQLD